MMGEYRLFSTEPNGYLHIGRQGNMSGFYLFAEEYGGICNLRFDD